MVSNRFANLPTTSTAYRAHHTHVPGCTITKITTAKLSLLSGARRDATSAKPGVTTTLTEWVIEVRVTAEALFTPRGQIESIASRHHGRRLLIGAFRLDVRPP